MIDQTAFDQVAKTLARHFDSMYYIEIESGNYCEFMPAQLLEGLNIPKQGDDFFTVIYTYDSFGIHIASHITAAAEDIIENFNIGRKSFFQLW